MDRIGADRVVDLEPYRAAGIPEKLRRVLGFRPVEAAALVVAPLVALVGVVIVAFVIDADPFVTGLLVILFSGPAALSAAEVGALGWLWSRWTSDAIAFTDALLDVSRLALRDAERLRAGGLLDPTQLETFLRSMLRDVLAPLLDEALTTELAETIGFIVKLYAKFLVRMVELAIPKAVERIANDPTHRRALAEGVARIDVEPVLLRIRDVLVAAERRMLVLRVVLFGVGCLILLAVAFGPLLFLHELSSAL